MTKPISLLRKRMIEDMAIRNMAPSTQAAYVRSVARFAAHYRTSPDKLTFEDVRRFQVHLISQGLKTATINDTQLVSCQSASLPRVRDLSPSVICSV